VGGARAGGGESRREHGCREYRRESQDDLESCKTVEIHASSLDSCIMQKDREQDIVRKHATKVYFTDEGYLLG